MFNYNKYIFLVLLIGFAFSKPDIVIKSPKSKQKLRIGDIHQIKWKTNKKILKEEKIKIFVSYDSGLKWNLISITENDGKYNWQVPQINSTNCLIKIQNIDNSFRGVSKKEFKIDGPQIIITNPHEKDIYSGGQKIKVRWNSKKINNELVNIYFSKNDGLSWQSIATNIVNFGLHTWTVPHFNDLYEKCLIKIVSNTSKIISISDNFSIINESNKIRIIHPNGGELLEGGKAFNIIWESDALKSELFKIMFSDNNGRTWKRVESRVLNTNEFMWFAPEIEADQCLIKIIAVENENIFDVSEKTFRISKLPSIKILKPQYNDKYFYDNKISIEWNTVNVRGKKVNIYHSLDKGKKWSVIDKSVPNNGKYLWDISEFDTTSFDSKIRIELSNNINISDKTNGFFTIFGKPYLNLNLNHIPKIVEDNSTIKINWSSKNLKSNRLNLYYSVDNGISWNDIEKDISDKGFYNWNIPNLKTSKCYIKVQSTTQSEIKSVSKKAINITDKPIIIIQDINSKKQYVLKDSLDIYWESYNLSDNYVDISYSENLNEDWKIIGKNIPDIGYKKIEVPYISKTSDNCRIKISDSYDSKNESISKTMLNIKRPRGIIYLNDQKIKTFDYDDKKNIKWSQDFLDDKKVRLLYSLDGTKNWKIIDEVKANLGSYMWKIPKIEKISKKTNIKLDVIDAEYDYVDNYGSFMINPAPFISLIEKVDTVKTNMPFEIKFKLKNIDYNQVSLSYSLTGGMNWVKISDDIKSNSYFWDVPSLKGFKNIKIKLASKSDENIYDLIELPILEQSINLKLLNPNGGETFYVDEVTKIVWSTKKIYDKNIDLYFSKDGGKSWTDLALNVENKGNYDWKISNEMNSNKCKIKVQSTTKKGIFDVTDDFFKIISKPSFRIITPNGKDILYKGTSSFIYWEPLDKKIANISLSYSIDNGLNWIIIKSNIVNNGKYNWAIPKQINNSKYCLIRINDFNNENKYDISDQTFTIK